MSFCCASGRFTSLLSGRLCRSDTGGAFRSILEKTERIPCHAEIKVNDRFRLLARLPAGIPSLSLHEGLPSAHRLEHRIWARRPFSFCWTAFFCLLIPLRGVACIGRGGRDTTANGA
ncbi:hypothetical protein NGR_c12520 [Sinorhizobium fredii NGR234]|uniref:Uncharacterized protein n=1 Tax=Sinorhizobium fredii (strain NBRC 101917 / NGR234) TaxID=394 RepID=C3MB40_SINFN|nr:hypothetical protein NGR_c12520 [Sinorhizobium fredii NGR234]